MNLSIITAIKLPEMPSMEAEAGLKGVGYLIFFAGYQTESAIVQYALEVCPVME